MNGFFITLEGTDGVGKSTHAHLLKKWLQKRGHKVVLTREPGGGMIAEKLRDMLLDPHLHIDNLTELFLYQAARANHVQNVIRPALQKRAVVICDRFTDATLAYQGDARGLPKKSIRILNRIATSNLNPHLTLLLDLPPKKGLKKALNRTPGSQGDRVEKEGLKFQNKVRDGYRRILRANPRRVKLINVQDRIIDTQRIIRFVVGQKISR